MTRTIDIFDFLNTLAPFDSQEKWDNSGFLVGDKDAQCKKIALCLDITSDTIEQAKKQNCGLIVSHHPVIFSKTGSFLKDDLPFKLAVNGISAICAHTCLDISAGGVNDVLAQMLELEEITPVCMDGVFMPRAAKLKKPMRTKEFAAFVKEKLGCDSLRISKIDKEIKTVVLCGGSGSSFLPDVFDGKYDAFITGDAGHHNFLDAAEKGLVLIAAGHFETENPVMSAVEKAINKKFPEIETVLLEQSSPIENV
ncbi:MAG: Nif3-like dinuclear metal center hexameric protein [Clostridia bacterium]|nr:Nif3-like dinuclear metal center hexameric protein [Clostridia bacterium]